MVPTPGPPARRARRGRRPKGRGDAREDILRAALHEFARRGYEGASVREISRGARVDPALVYHYFGDKEGLFVESMRAQMHPPSEGEVPAKGSRSERAERVVRAFLDRWGGRGEPTPLLALMRSASSDPEAAALVRDLFARQIVPWAAASLPSGDIDRSVALIGSTLFGVAFLRYIVRLEPLASASAEDLGRWIGPALLRYMTESLD